jgi:membrane fusion protein (multidrug efflux system)
MKQAAACAALLATVFFAIPAIAQTPPPPPAGWSGDVRLNLVPRRTTILSAEIAAQIVELSVREGDAIQDGQRLVALDCAIHRARLARADALLLKARRQAESQRDLDQRGATSPLERDVALAELAAAEAEAAGARVPVTRCAIAAPFGGRVGEVRAQRWQFVREGEPILEIVDDREMEIEMIVASILLPDLRPGARFRVAIDEVRKEYAAEVTRTAARIDPVSQTVKIFARIVGRHPELLSGMSGTALLAPAPSR